MANFVEQKFKELKKNRDKSKSVQRLQMGRKLVGLFLGAKLVCSLQSNTGHVEKPSGDEDETLPSLSDGSCEKTLSEESSEVNTSERTRKICFH